MNPTVVLLYHCCCVAHFCVLSAIRQYTRGSQGPVSVWIICGLASDWKLQNYQPLERPGEAQRYCSGTRHHLMRWSHPRASIPLPTAGAASPLWRHLSQLSVLYVVRSDLWTSEGDILKYITTIINGGCRGVWITSFLWITLKSSRVNYRSDLVICVNFSPY